LFRIERNLVKLGSKLAVRVDKETGGLVEDKDQPVEDEPLEEAPEMNVPQYHINTEEVINEARAKAKHIIEDARNEAENIIQKSEDEAKNIIQKSEDEAEENKRLAWDEGYAAGVVEGKESFDDKIIECEESLKRVMLEFHEAKERAFVDMQDELAGLALSIVRKIINPADEEMTGIFESLIKNALRQIAPDDKVMLRVSAADYERYFPEGSTVFELGSGVTVSASILKDISLNEFDCIIDKDDSTVNAGLETQLKHVELAFRKG